MSKAVHAAGLERIELERLRTRVGQLFATLQEATDDTSAPLPGVWLPAIDLCESSDAVTLRVEVPGVRAEQIQVSLSSTCLRISGKKRKRSVPRGRLVHLCSERIFGDFERVVSLRWPIDVNGATAELQNGILVVHLPKLRDRRGMEFKVAVKEIDI